MTYEMYRYVFIGSAVLSVLFLLVSVLLFILLKIPKVIGDLSGSNARKGVEKIRQQNTSSGRKTYKSSRVNLERGRLTDKISESGQVIPAYSNTDAGSMATSKISTAILTTSGETTPLDFGGNETTILSPVQDVFFEIEFDITYIHSEELIE